MILIIVKVRLEFSFSSYDMGIHYGEEPGAFMKKPFYPEGLLQLVMNTQGSFFLVSAQNEKREKLFFMCYVMSGHL